MVLLPVVHLSIKLPLRIRDPTLSTIEPHPPFPAEILPIESSFIFEDPLEAFATSALTMRNKLRVVNLHDASFNLLVIESKWLRVSCCNVICQLGPVPGGGLGYFADGLGLGGGHCHVAYETKRKQHQQNSCQISHISKIAMLMCMQLVS